MNKAQMADLLNLIASTDGRNLTQQMPNAWMELLGDLSFPDCKQAVLGHYRESTEWLMPAHIRRRVSAVRQRRINAVGENINASRADSADPKEEIRVQRALTKALGDGTLTVADYGAYHRSGIEWDAWTGRELAS